MDHWLTEMHISKETPQVSRKPDLTFLGPTNEKKNDSAAEASYVVA
jgi:hypothetical protein